MLLSAVLLVIAEQIYRNAPADTRSGLKYFCLAVVGMFLYDIAMYAWSFVERAIPPDAWAARGYVNALFAIPLAYSVKRTFRLSLEALLPRQILFYSFALIAISAFLGFLMAGEDCRQHQAASDNEYATQRFNRPASIKREQNNRHHRQ